MNHDNNCLCLNHRTPEQNDQIEGRMQIVLEDFLNHLEATFKGQPELEAEAMAKLNGMFCVKNGVDMEGLFSMSKVIMDFAVKSSLEKLAATNPAAAAMLKVLLETQT